MSGYLGDFTTSNTVYVLFNTFDSNDPSASVAIAAFIAGDIEIYKDGSVTQRSSDAGYTLLDTDGIDFDGHVGIGGFSIDLSDNTDAGFYATGSEYIIVVGPTTVDAAVINFVAGSFSIERAGGALALAKGASGFVAIKDETALIVADTNELQTDDIPGKLPSALVGGRIDATIDATGFEDAAVDKIWDEDATGHQAGGTFGQAIGDPGANAETMYDAVVTDASGTNVAADVVALNDPTAATIADSVWNEAMSGHLTIGTYGHAMRGLAPIDGSVEASGSNSTTQAQTDLAEATNAHYANGVIVFTTGAERGQFRLITTYTGATGVVVWERALTGTPASGDDFVIVAAPGNVNLRSATQTSVDAIETDTNSLNDTKVSQTLNLTASGNIGIDWANVENPTTALDLSATDIQLVDTTTTNSDMRGTNSAALASVLGALNDAAAAGEVTTADTAIQYIKQLINVLIGTPGIGTFPSATAPANAVSLAEVIRAIYDDTNAMVFTSAGRVDSNVEAINDQTASAVNLRHSTSAAGIVRGAAEAGTLSTTQMTTDLTEATDDHYVGRVVIWLSGVLLGQGSDITAYAGATGMLTYTTLTEAPSATDTFMIV